MSGVFPPFTERERRSVTRRGWSWPAYVLAVELFRRYGSVERGQFRPLDEWRPEAEELLAIVRRASDQPDPDPRHVDELPLAPRIPPSEHRGGPGGLAYAALVAALIVVAVITVIVVAPR